MLQLMKLFWAICGLKAGPQDLPKRHYLLIAMIIAGIIVDSFAESSLIPELSGFEIIKILTIYNLVLLAAIFYLLKLLGYAERGLQTVTAMAGSSLIISLVLLPGLLMITSTAEQNDSFVLLVLIDNVWRIAVNAHIFRHAFSVRLLMAMILSLSHFLLGALIADILLSASGAS